MKRTLQAVFLAVFATQALVVGQGDEVKRVLAQIRSALGGEEKLAALKTIAVQGQSTRPSGDGTAAAQDFEMAFELPAGAIKFVKKDVVLAMGDTTISKRSGFNGNEVIEDIDAPPGMISSSTAGGGMRIMRMDPGGPGVSGAQVKPEQLAAQKSQAMLTNRREFARFALGMIGTTTSAYPVEFTYGGKVDAVDGKADVLEVKSADGFAAKLYVDGKTHLPLMLAWMDKEPLRMTMGGGTALPGGGRLQTFSTNGAAGTTAPPDPAKVQEEMAARMKEAEANRKTVEFQIYYADYKPVDGVLMPTRIQRWTDGVATEELSLDKIKVNGKIDPAKFAVK